MALSVALEKIRLDRRVDCALADYRRRPDAQLHADKWEQRQHEEDEVSPSSIGSFVEDMLSHFRCLHQPSTCMLSMILVHWMTIESLLEYANFRDNLNHLPLLSHLVWIHIVASRYSYRRVKFAYRSLRHIYPGLLKGQEGSRPSGYTMTNTVRTAYGMHAWLTDHCSKMTEDSKSLPI